MTANRPNLPRLHIVPCSLATANEYITKWHRHHPPLRIHKVSLAVADDTDRICGVAILSRPCSRMRDDGFTAEVARVATDGTPNACSALLGACWRVARALGYTRLGTYTLQREPGTSLKAAGWHLLYVSPGGDWSRHPRPGKQRPLGPKQLWEPKASRQHDELRAA